MHGYITLVSVKCTVKCINKETLGQLSVISKCFYNLTNNS